MAKGDAAIPCREWPFIKDRYGYGVVKIKGKMRKAHRVSLEIEIGRRLSADEMVIHSCNNRSCIEPSHLSVGDAAKNSADRIKNATTQADVALPGWRNVYEG